MRIPARPTTTWTMLGFATFVLCATAAGADKTLVSWVALANPLQRGGSALTIQRGDQFDAVVFGETAMPDSPPDNWLTYHLLHPGPGGAMPGDPNCAFFWKGRRRRGEESQGVEDEIHLRQRVISRTHSPSSGRTS